MLIHSVERHEGSADTEYLKQRHTVYPFGGDGDEDKLLSHKRKSEETREDKECREAHHLAEHT